MNIIRELRKKKGVQQKDLALEIGVSNPTVSDWENGKKDPSGERLKKLAIYFDVDELVILGKGSPDGSIDIPKTVEGRIISGGVDQLPKDQREQAVNIMQAVFPQYSNFFKLDK